MVISFKVVRNNGNNNGIYETTNWLYSGRTKDLCLKYELGKWTEPILPHSYIFVYESKKQAIIERSKLSINGLGPISIIKCEC